MRLAAVHSTKAAAMAWSIARVATVTVRAVAVTARSSRSAPCGRRAISHLGRHEDQGARGGFHRDMDQDRAEEQAGEQEQSGDDCCDSGPGAGSDTDRALDERHEARRSGGGSGDGGAGVDEQRLAHAGYLSPVVLERCVRREAHHFRDAAEEVECEQHQNDAPRPGIGDDAEVEPEERRSASVDTVVDRSGLDVRDGAVQRGGCDTAQDRRGPCAE
jgi:hypothetical protein